MKRSQEADHKLARLKEKGWKNCTYQELRWVQNYLFLCTSGTRPYVYETFDRWEILKDKLKVYYQRKDRKAAFRKKVKVI